MASSNAPILPTNLHDPEGTNAPVKKASKDLNKRLREVVELYIGELEQIPATVFVTNAERYAYQLDNGLLQSLLQSLDWLVDEILLEGGEPNLWFWSAYVQPAYERGTAKTVRNLARQSPAYKAERATLRDVMQTDAYSRRLILIRAREFEEMKGFTATVKGDMARVLTDGIARGRNPLEIARNLREQTGIEEFRAERIARTEINTALRRARWDEAEDAQERYGLKMMQMHLSALSPTTRRSHAARHGNLYTVEQARDWFASGANSINCKCSSTEVLVDNNGEPIVGFITERAQAMRRKYEESLNDDAD